VKPAIHHAAVFAILILAGLPRGFEPIRVGVDESWIAGLHYAFAEKLRFGIDVVFTYGPWGFASAPLAFAPTMPWVVGCQILLKFAIAGAIIGLISGPRSNLGFFVATVAAFVFLDPEVGEIACWFWLLNECVGGRYGRGWAGVACALLAVGKGTHLWLALLTAVASLVWDLFRRRAPIGAIAFMTTATAAWLAAGQRVGDVPAFLAGSWEIAKGYSAAMSVWNRFDWFAAPMVVGSLLVILPMRRTLGVAPFVAAVLLAGAAFKIGFVRVGPERVATALATMIVAAVAVAAADRRAWNRSMIAGILVLFATGVFLPAEHRWDGLVHGSMKRFDPTLYAWREGLRGEPAESADLDVGFNPQGRSIDVGPHHQSLAVGNEWNYQPRPVFQSYQAYTASLAARNASFFSGQSAPQEVLAFVEPLDLRFAAMDDGLCWLEWRRGYRVEGNVGPFIRLVRREKPLHMERRLIESVRRRFGERWTPPAPPTNDGFILAELVFDETLLHRSATLAYKSVRPTISVDNDEARELIPSVAQAGIVISPAIQKTDSLRRFLNGESVSGPTSVVVDAPQPLYGRDYEVRLFEMTTSEN
jgi:hypothetical protein